MAGVGSVVRIIGGIVLLALIALVASVTYAVADPFYLNLGFADAASLGWDNSKTMMRFAGLSLVGLSLVVILWMVLAPIRADVRQELQ